MRGDHSPQALMFATLSLGLDDKNHHWSLQANSQDKDVHVFINKSNIVYLD